MTAIDFARDASSRRDGDRANGSRESEPPAGMFVDDDTHEAPETVPLVTFVDHDDLFAPEPASSLLVAALGIAPGPAVGIFGQGYVGKTIVAMSAGIAVALGRDLWGLYAVRRGVYVHFDHEQGRRLTKTRVQRIAAGFGACKEDLRDRIRVAIYPRLNLTSPGAEDEYARAFEGAGVAVLDALKGITPGVDENSSVIRDYMGVLARASEKTGCVPLLLHHAGKTDPNGSKPRKETGRGSSAIFDECSTVLVLTAKKGEPIYVTHEKDRELGGTVADFGLRIEDVTTPDCNPKGGLRVVHLDREQMATPKADAGAKFAKAIESVRECISDNPGVAGADAVRELLGIAAQPVRAAVATLLANGDVVERKGNGGTGRGRRLFLKQAAPAEGA